MSKGKVLIIGSNARRIEIVGGGWGPTGQYLNETVVPAMALVDAGYEVVLATPDGTPPYIDPASDSAEHFGGDPQAYQKARAYYDSDPAMTQPRPLWAVIEGGLDAYAGVFVPGGQGPVVDLMQDAEVGQILRHFHARRRPTALLCHGPIALAAALPKAREFRAALIAGDRDLAARLAREWPYAGYKMTVFTASEEKPIEERFLHGKIYFTMPDALGLAGAEVSRGEIDFDPYVVEDRELITGQNPRSDHPIAARLIAALDRATVPA